MLKMQAQTEKTKLHQDVPTVLMCQYGPFKPAHSVTFPTGIPEVPDFSQYLNTSDCSRTVFYVFHAVH
jgi:hypothetical protein